MPENDEMNLQQQQQQQETTFKTEQNFMGNLSEKMNEALIESTRKESMSEKDSLEKKLEKADLGITAEEIKTTEKAASTDPDDEQTQYNMDFQKTDIAFSKFPKEPPQNPRAAIKGASNLFGN